MEKYAGAEEFIRILNRRGVENIFFNPGIDTVPVQVTISRLKAAGKKTPSLVLCLDESVAMAAAHGHYMISGQPQVVMAHRELGTFQVGGQWTNVQAGRVPVVFCAGLPGRSNRTTWQGKSFDQGSIVRNNVKWDFEVAEDEDLGDGASKALEVATREPSGPVYLAPTWEAMLKKNLKSIVAPLPAFSPPAELDETLLRRAAKILLQAENPLIMAGQSGRFAESVQGLVKLAEILAARVISSPVRVNFPTNHPLFAGIDPIGGGSRSLAHYLTEADAVFLIDYDLPYAAMPITPSAEAKIIYLTRDSSKKRDPLWGKKAALFLESDSRQVIPRLGEIIQQSLPPGKKADFSARAQRIGREHENTRSELLSTAKARSAQKPICSDWLCQCISQVVNEETIIVNQTITQSSFVGEQIPRSQPHTLLGCAGGSIGWALGAALGAKIAAPAKTVVSLMGDGAFVWGCPESTLWTAKTYHAPFLAVIFNNRAYGAIKGLVQRAYGEDRISPQTGLDSGVDIASPPDYARVAEACGAFGRTVKDPAEIMPALRAALSEVKNGRAAVLDVWL